MLQLSLDMEKATVLTHLLEESIMELHQEISRTERSDYREGLRSRLALLKKILGQIHESEQHPIAA